MYTFICKYIYIYIYILNIYMYVCAGHIMCVYVCMYVCVRHNMSSNLRRTRYIHIIHIHVCMYVLVILCVHMCVCMYVWERTWVLIWGELDTYILYIYMYVCMCWSYYVCICVYNKWRHWVTGRAETVREIKKWKRRRVKVCITMLTIKLNVANCA